MTCMHVLGYEVIPPQVCSVPEAGGLGMEQLHWGQDLYVLDIIDSIAYDICLWTALQH